MRKLPTFLARLLIATPAVAVVAHLGCSSSKSASPAGETPGDDSGAADSAATTVEEASTEAQAATGLSLTWKVNVQSPALGGGELDAGDAAASPAVPVVSATVCVNGMAAIPCTTTDSTGTFTLAGLPASTELVVTVVATGYRSIALPIVTGTSVMNAASEPVAMQKSTDPEPSIGPPIDWADAGVVDFFALGPGAIVPGSGPEGVPGAAVALAPTSGVGPEFLTDQNTFEAGATLIDVAGVIYNVTPGNYTLTFTDPSGDCEPITTPFPAWGYPGTAHDVTFPVLKGFVTTAGVYCTPTGQARTDGGSDAASEVSSGDAAPPDASSDAVAD